MGTDAAAGPGRDAEAPNTEPRKKPGGKDIFWPKVAAAVAESVIKPASVIQCFAIFMSVSLPYLTV